MPRTYKVVVTETYTHRFTVEADTDEDAHKQAEALAIDAAWDQGEPLTCERDTEIVES